MSPPNSTSILLLARAADPVGSGREIEIAAAALHDAGCDVHVGFTSAGGWLPSRLATMGLPVHRLGLRPWPDVAATCRLARLIGQLRPGTVLAWGRSQMRLAAMATRVPMAGFHRPRLVCRVALPPRGLGDAWALTRADRVLASSLAVATACEKAGVWVRRLDTIEPVADVASPAGLSRQEIATRLELDPAKLWSLCVAPLVASSRLDRLLWAIDQLGVVRRDVEHVLVGGGPLLHRLRRRARVQHLAERLQIVPMGECLPDLLREVRFVWQSGSVAVGGALFDAMSAGKPTVAVTSDAARQAILDGQTGWIVPPLPESEFPRRAFSLVEDEAIASRFGAAARERAATLFSSERFVSRLRAAVLEDKAVPPVAEGHCSGE